LDEGLEAARKKKLESLKRENEEKEQEGQLKEVLRRVLTEGAYGRLMNVRLANSQMYAAASRQLLGLYQKAGRKITEGELVSLLKALKGEKRETKITFK
jgi:DNA-binding TFAR19-related protein (PDSD5 family)